MKKFGIIGLATLVTTICMGGGAMAQIDPGSRLGITDGTSNQHAVQQVYQTYLGRDASAGQGGGENGLIGLLHTGPGNMPTDQLPAVQRNDLIQNAYGDLLGRDTGKGAAGELVPAVMPTDQKAKLGSLNGLGSTNQLFVNSRGGDQDPMLLPAVQKVREAAARSQAGAHGGGGGGAGKVQMQDFHFVPLASVPDAPERGALNFANVAHGAGSGGGAGKSLDARGLNFTNQGGNAVQNQQTAGAGPHVKVFSGNGTTGASGPQVSPGAAKGLNFATTVRK